MSLGNWSTQQGLSFLICKIGRMKPICEVTWHSVGLGPTEECTQDIEAMVRWRSFSVSEELSNLVGKAFPLWPRRAGEDSLHMQWLCYEPQHLGSTRGKLASLSLCHPHAPVSESPRPAPAQAPISKD